MVEEKPKGLEKWELQNGYSEKVKTLPADFWGSS
jgi:hypothetical protein